MLVAERPRFRRGKEEEERRLRELQLSHYSVNLSHRLLTNNGKEPLSATLPDGVVRTFQIGSLRERDAYWKERGSVESFGEQMLDWLGNSEKPGISQWIEGQQNVEAEKLLQAVGLKSTSAEQTERDMQHPEVVKLVGAINADLEKAGEDPLDTGENTLNEADRRALIFYATYLNPKDASGKEARSLIETLVDTASELSGGDSMQTRERLQAVSPLFNVVGEDARHALGALAIATLHGKHGQGALQQVASGAHLQDEERLAWKFIRDNRLARKPEQLKAGEQQSVVETFAHLEPESEKENNPYFIQGDLPANITSQLTPEQLRVWELRKPFFVPRGDRMVPNREVFAPAYDLRNDERFINAEELTNDDSGLFALAAASAPTPEKQAALYRALGEIAVRSHRENPQLLGEFLQSQGEKSLRQFAKLDDDIAQAVLDQRKEAGGPAMEHQILDEVRAAFEKDAQKKVDLQHLTDEQQAFMNSRFLTLRGAVRHDVLQNFSQFPNRLFALKDAGDSLHPGENVLDNQDYRVVDIPTTLPVWQERVPALQEALQREPLALTPEQIRQIEFLAHSVDVVKVVEFLQGQQTGVPEVAQPTRRIAAPAPFIEAATLVENPVLEAQTVPVTEQPVLEAAAPAAPAPEAVAKERMEAEAPVAAPEVQKGFLESQFAKLTIPPHKGHNFYTDTPDIIRPVGHLSDWKRFLLREPVGEQRIPNLGTYVMLEDKQTGEMDIKGMDYQKLFLRDLRQAGTRANEAQDMMWHENARYYNANHKNDNYGMDATLFAFAADAAATPADQAKIFSAMAEQVLSLYEANPELTERARAYLTYVNRIGSKWPKVDVDSLVGTEVLLQTRSREIRDRLRSDNITQQDMLDISLLALPFDLRKLAKGMEEAAHMPPAPEAGEGASPAE